MKARVTGATSSGSQIASRYKQLAAMCLAAMAVVYLLTARNQHSATTHAGTSMQNTVSVDRNTDSAAAPQDPSRTTTHKEQFFEGSYDPKKVRPGTFAYLVMGSGMIEEHWRRVVQDDSVELWYLAWKTNPSLGPGDNSKIRVIYFPKSSWASGRNTLMQTALDVEAQQGWAHEYFIFLDEDVRLDVRLNETAVAPSDHVAADTRFRELLLRDRPARAGIELPRFYGDLQLIPMPCVRNCAYDAALDAFHRSALAQVLPYETRFDTINWWASSEITSFRSAGLLSPYCNTYREVIHNSFKNSHGGNYPMRKGFKEMAAAAYTRCLGRQDVSERIWRDMYTFGFSRVQGEGEKCTRQNSSVNYYAVLSDEQKRIRLCSLNRVTAATGSP